MKTISALAEVCKSIAQNGADESMPTSLQTLGLLHGVCFLTLNLE